ncbi:MAG: hypothetical protein KH378_08300 [Butyrivibrio sp.]|nr:hypothetical protein [Butyrivibrio sp.]
MVEEMKLQETDEKVVEIELIGEECGDSPKQVQRYIKLTDLIPKMLDAMEFVQCTPSLSQTLGIKKLSADGKLKVQDMEDILSEIM